MADDEFDKSKAVLEIKHHVYYVEWLSSSGGGHGC